LNHDKDRPKRFSRTGPFREQISEASRRAGSRIVLALDLDFRKKPSSLIDDAMSLFDATKDYLSAVKLNFHLILPLSFSELSRLNMRIASTGLPIIADLKLNDISNTNRVATEYLWSAGFSAVIVNPFVGFDGGLDAVFKSALEMGKGVITLAYMSHPGGVEGYGLELKTGNTMFDLFLRRAIEWNADGIVIGSTRPERITYARERIPSSMLIFSPGSGAQGGNPHSSINAGTDYLIYGRSIIEDEDPAKAAKTLAESTRPLKGTRQLRAKHS
jgi:orotidine-5'-phosphate decarboxylase